MSISTAEVIKRNIVNLFFNKYQRTRQRVVLARGPFSSAEERDQVQEIQRDFVKQELDDRFKKEPLEFSTIVREYAPFAYGISKMTVEGGFTLLNDAELTQIITDAFDAGYQLRKNETTFSDS